MALQSANAASPYIVLLITSIALLLTPTLVVAGRDPSLYDVRNVSQYSDGSDLAHYMSRPDLRPPILNVTQYDPAAISPGYWFVAPYGEILPEPDRWEYQPFEVGPHIYDNAGNLVWSGAPMVDHRNAFDFKAVTYNGSQHLTFVIGSRPRSASPSDDLQLGYIANSAYQVQDKVNVNRDSTILDIHEFHVVDEGKTALMTTTKVQLRNVSEVGVSGLEEKHVANKGFQEVDLATGNINFEWDALENGVSLTESYNVVEFKDPKHKYWDFFHINSVDKGEDGHYLISARYTNTIYKISAIDGSILWRLGGELSDFELLDGFNFTSQHHARLQSENETMTMITLFDNASDDSGRQAPTSRCSSGKLVALDTATSPMTARLIQQWERPDGLLTDKRGNVQILPNTNVVVGWGDRGYLSEFAPDGHRILDAEYMSSRFGNYRAYKFSFTGSPMEPPALRTYAYGSGMSLADMVSVFYVSWNGATEVAKWNFYGSHKKSGRFSMVGSSAKTGFETSYMSARYIKYTYAEAISSDGRILGKSHVQKTILPNGLDALTDLTIPNIPHTNSTNSTKQQADVTALLPSHESFGPIAIIVIAILLAFSLLGMVAMVYFLWNRKTLLSRGIYAPVTSSDTLESSELSALAYHDQEVEK